MLQQFTETVILPILRRRRESKIEEIVTELQKLSRHLGRLLALDQDQPQKQKKLQKRLAQFNISRFENVFSKTDDRAVLSALRKTGTTLYNLRLSLDRATFDEEHVRMWWSAFTRAVNELSEQVDA